MKILDTIGLMLVALYLSEARNLENLEDVNEEKGTFVCDECKVKLDFSNMGLSTIRPNFITGLKIISLVLQHNSIEGFQGDTFGSLPNLEHLDLSNNKIPKTKLFSFGSIPSLKTLILDNNFGDEIFGYSRQCPEPSIESSDEDDETSECVESRYERYSALDPMVYYPEITHLSLRNIFMDSITNRWAVYFPKVVNFDVSNNKLASADDFFEQLPSSVKNLTMQNVGLTSIRVKSLKNVTSLDLNLNRFHIIKRSGCENQSLCLDNFDKLETLSIGSCSVKKIERHAFKHAMKLLYLDISNNYLTEIPDGTFGYAPSLSYLDISRNPFVNISFIAELTNLTTLKMNGMEDNHSTASLWSIPSLPKIQVISLRDNGILYIPPMFMENLQDLREIDLSDNQLTFLSPGLWQRNLRTIHMNDNRVSSIEDLHLSEAASLQLLELERNNVTNIKFSAIKELPDTVLLKL